MENKENIEMLTRIRDWIRFAMSEFKKVNLYYGHGTDNELDEAVYLILHTLHLPLDMPAHLFDCVLTLEERIKIQEMIIKRIETRKPAAYLTHESFFMGLPFYVDERVLIPRSPIAELIQNHFQPWIHENLISNILDLCTGSGCIAAACAVTFPDAKIIASDISQEALDVAKFNIEKLHIEKHVQLIQSNIFENIPLQKFDVIVSNPPYVNKSDMDALPPEYLHEPAQALQAGNDGLKIIRKILTTAKKYLSDKGILIVEVGNSAEALIKQFPEIDFTWLEFEKSDAEVFLLMKNQLR